MVIVYIEWKEVSKIEEIKGGCRTSKRPTNRTREGRQDFRRAEEGLLRCNTATRSSC